MFGLFKSDKKESKTNDDEKKESFSEKIYLSNEYLSLFPKNTDWVNNKLVNIVNNEQKYDESRLDNWVPPDAKNPHKYFNVVQEALNLFHKWRKWQVKKDEWILMKEDKKNNFVSYYGKLDKEDISATKGTMIIPYSVPVIVGLQHNVKHAIAFDDLFESAQEIENLNEFSNVCYARFKSPFVLIKGRDFVSVDFHYDLGNGEYILGSKSIDSYDYNKNDKYVRGSLTLDLLHFRPYYEKDINHSVVTHYSHTKMNGSLPGWAINQFVSENPQCLLDIKNYLDKNKDKLGNPGFLFIPHELLIYLGIEDKKKEAEPAK